MENKNKSNSFTHGVVLGTIIGFAIGTLLIPPQGEENRKKLKSAKKKADQKYDELNNIIQTQVLPIIDDLKPVIKETGKKMKPIERKAVNQITHLAELSIESIEKRKNKSNKNAAKRKFFKASF